MSSAEEIDLDDLGPGSAQIEAAPQRTTLWLDQRTNVDTDDDGDGACTIAGHEAFGAAKGIEVEVAWPMGMSFDGNASAGFYVLGLKPGSNAEATGKITVGLKFDRVNGTAVANKSKQDIVALIKSGAGPKVSVVFAQDTAGYQAFSAAKNSGGGPTDPLGSNGQAAAAPAPEDQFEPGQCASSKLHAHSTERGPCRLAALAGKHYCSAHACPNPECSNSKCGDSAGCGKCGDHVSLSSNHWATAVVLVAATAAIFCLAWVEAPSSAHASKPGPQMLCTDPADAASYAARGNAHYGDCCQEYGLTPKPLWVMLLHSLLVALVVDTPGYLWTGKASMFNPQELPWHVLLFLAAQAAVACISTYSLLAAFDYDASPSGWDTYQGLLFLWLNSSPGITVATMVALVGLAITGQTQRAAGRAAEALRKEIGGEAFDALDGDERTKRVEEKASQQHSGEGQEGDADDPVAECIFHCEAQVCTGLGTLFFWPVIITHMIPIQVTVIHGIPTFLAWACWMGLAKLAHAPPLVPCPRGSTHPPLRRVLYGK